MAGPIAVSWREELPRAVPLALELPRFYWSRPAAGVRVLALGEAARREVEAGAAGPLVAELTRPGQIDWRGEGPLPPGPWVGASAFDPEQPRGRSWKGFAAARFVLPELLTWSEGGRHFAAAFALAGGDPERLVAALRARVAALRARLEGPIPPLPAQPPLESPVPELAARAAWEALVEEALAAIRSGALHKVVVARGLEVRAAGPLDPRPALAALERRHPTCRIFCLRGDDEAWFLGATPELLCTVEGGELATEALAGTARIAEAPALLESAKDLREHRWVVEHLIGGLAPLTEQVTAPEQPRLRELADVAHLLTPVAARLKEGLGAGDVVTALHPTPAVGGVPGPEALRFLGAHEHLRRGLYAGLVGLLGEGRAELAVALRSALLRGERARLFAGAGIVEGSRAEEEWRETELKAAAMLSALASAEPARPARAARAGAQPERPA